MIDRLFDQKLKFLFIHPIQLILKLFQFILNKNEVLYLKEKDIFSIEN